MAEKAVATAAATDELEIPPTSTSIPAEDPPATTDNGDSSEKPTDSNNDFDTTVVLLDLDHQQPNRKRRRKSCPESLVDTIRQYSNSSSFTFDTPFCATPDSTPKFGSFDSEKNRRIIPEVRDARSESEVVAGAEEEEEEEKSEVSGGGGERREASVGSVDGVVGSGVD